MQLEQPVLNHALSSQKNMWNCSNCTFQNSGLLISCELCGKEQVDNSFQICKFCESQNKLNDIKCTVCQSPLDKFQEQYIEKQKQTYIVYCPQCLFLNHKDNQICLGCEHSFIEKVQQSIQQQICPICAMELQNKERAKQHIKQCEQSLHMIQQMKFEEQQIHKIQPLIVKPINPIKLQFIKPIRPKPYPSIIKPSNIIAQNSKSCPHCNIHIVESKFQSHLLTCKYEGIDISTIDKIKAQALVLTPLVSEVISFMKVTSKVKHLAAQNKLKSRIKKIGFKQNDLQALQHYVENYAPIIVHIHINKYMQFFVKDTHYRNQFQTGKSSGSLSRQSRITWQNRMFSNKYQKAKDHERVKYGTINFTNDPAGVAACKSYGNSYFLLKSDVRQRCTFTDQDSSNVSSLIGTFKYGDHILQKLTDNQLKAAINAAKANQVSSSVVSTYKQIQIHGPLQFARDIQRLYVNKSELIDTKFRYLVEQFSAKFSVDYEIF